ncbi:glycosyl hydrolase-related protein [Paenibacillus mangrovi]
MAWSSFYTCSLIEEEEEKLGLKDKNRVVLPFGPREIRTLKLKFHAN